MKELVPAPATTGRSCIICGEPLPDTGRSGRPSIYCRIGPRGTTCADIAQSTAELARAHLARIADLPASRRQGFASVRSATLGVLVSELYAAVSRSEGDNG